MTRQGNVSILIKVRDGSKAALAAAQTQYQRFATKVRSIFATASKYIAGFGVAGMLIGLRKMVQASIVAQNAQAQLGAVIKSTGGIAGQSAEALNAHAAALQRVTTYGDETINGMQSLLLTFTQIQGDTFPRATEAVMNVATAMGTDLKEAALQVGKALNDPVLGVTALARSGIQFTESQKEVIRTLVETGRQAEAQRLILDELDRQFGGSARAARETLGGALAALGNAWGDLFEVSAESSSGIIGVIESITAALPSMRDGLSDVVLEWGVLFVDIELGLAKMDRALGKSNAYIAGLVHGFTGGVFGGELLAEQTARFAKAEADIAALEQLKAERQRRIAGAGAPSAGAAGGGGRVAPPSGAGGGDGGSGMSLADMLKREQQIDAARAKREAAGQGDGFTETIGLTNAVNRGAGMEGLVGLGLPSAEDLNASIAQTMESLKQIEIVGPTAMEKIGASIAGAASELPTLEEQLRETVHNGLFQFTDAFAASFLLITEGWDQVGQAMEGAVRGAVSEMAAAMSRYYATLAGAAFGQALMGDARALVAAGKFLAAAAGFAALSGLAQGGGGGRGGMGGGGRGGYGVGIGGPLDDRRASPVTVIMPNSGVLNVNDPRTQDEFRAMLEKLSGRAVEIRRR